ncbi:outer membrane efflux protein [Buttiauxella gaviniae ATCC 51604]|uniref:Protein CyaE n=1 Tax=Buttiauxella gaviniae ATCC 51604 TaxID=1354253 RepID=A0A1B7HL40_9ENTR|nr:TolC family protein [Buttiauxella gaviniae]OAT16328.1 outer membrane efflux protein [Buttiauxella gaviniae ATCC 51604]
MNGKKYLLPLCLLGLLVQQAAFAEGFSQLLDDPLQTQPEQLQSGATLPDASRISCSQSVDFSQPMTLSGAVDTALCNNPQIRATWAEIKVQSGVVGEARAAYLPTLSGSVSRLRDSTVYSAGSQAPGVTSTGNQYYGSLNWRLFDFGGRAANRESANQMLLAAVAGHDAALQKVMVSVIQAWFETLTSQAEVDARQHIAELARQTLIVAKRRENLGASAQDDTLQATTALAKAELTAMRASGDYQKNIALLRQAMGIDLATEITLPRQPERVIPSDIHDLNEWLKQAEDRHPAIQQARAKWAADKDKIISVRSDGLPTVDLTAHMSRNGFPNQGLSSINQTNKDIGITISIPLFDGFSRHYKILEARAQAEQSEAQMEDTTAQIMTDVVKAYADAKTALNVLTASQQLLDAAQKSVQSVQRRYDKNVADILEVMNAQSALADAQQQRIEAIAAWQSARLSLLANTGILSKLSEGS